MVKSINDSHVNEVYLPGVPLPPTLKASGNLADVIDHGEIILLVVPSQFVASTMGRAGGCAGSVWWLLTEWLQGGGVVMLVLFGMFVCASCCFFCDDCRIIALSLVEIAVKCIQLVLGHGLR